jgi:hypothetical protein
VGRQAVPAQQADGPASTPGVQVVPMGWQDGLSQKSPAPPSPGGTQGMPPQHWSENWQGLPWVMQQLGSAGS